MQGLKIGHYSDQDKGTGVTVFLFENSAIGGYWICGSAPASHELAALDPDNSVPHCHGLVLTGGSAFGLHAAGGVMRYLKEKNIGHPVPSGVVPIVPAAAIYDLSYRSEHFPVDENAYHACQRASEGNIDCGRVGAGTGATVGKLIPFAKSMASGIGRAVLTQKDGLEVMAYAVVNSVGDVHDKGTMIAGARDIHGQFADCEKFLLSGAAEENLFIQANTTLAAIFTNAALGKDECKRIAKMGAAGLARSISPVFTRFDGDIVFCMSLGKISASELTVGTMAAEAVRLAVINAVKDSVIVDG
ncbi:MAG TPA: P1 family peptidase [Gammaproteobacteria bacterium]|jgi:L-aminopeptidase/D-esterase-like protein|nr:P1 family peptidase [Gammaproteobacteria bacterium]